MLTLIFGFHHYKIMNSKRLKGIVYLFLTSIIWGGSFISQFLGGNAIGSFSFIAYRGLFGCMTITFLILFNNEKIAHKICFFRDDEDKKLTIKNSIWCGIVLFLAMITQQIGVEVTDTAKSGLITSLEVILVPIIMLIFFKKKIKIVTWIFIITTMIGIMLLSINSVSGINVGDLLVFISAILYSITVIQIPQYIINVDPFKFSFFRFAVVGILCFSCALILREEPFNYEKFSIALPSILFSGIMSSGVAYTLQVLGQQYCEPVIATLIMSLEGIFAAIFGWIFLGQGLNLVQILGIIIAFISIVIVQITDANIS